MRFYLIKKKKMKIDFKEEISYGDDLVLSKTFDFLSLPSLLLIIFLDRIHWILKHLWENDNVSWPIPD